VSVDSVPAGNIVGITGLKKAFAGETVSIEDIHPFEGMIHVSEPVVTMAVEAKSMKDLPKVIEVLRQVAKEDPTLSVKIDEETGEHLLSGMGELHLEVITNRIKDGGLDIETSPPIVVYRETVTDKFGPVEGKSPNKHNKFYISVEPLERSIYDAIVSGELKEGRRKDRSKDLRARLVELGMDREEARRVIDIYRGNVMVDMTRGIQHLDEVMELMLDAFESVMDKGALANEPVTPTLLEPVQNVWIDVPQEYMGSITRELQRRRGIVVEMKQKEELMTIEGKMPVAESFGFAGDIRSASEGHALWSTENAGFEKVPVELQHDIIMKIRERKGLRKELPKAEEFME